MSPTAFPLGTGVDSSDTGALPTREGRARRNGGGKGRRTPRPPLFLTGLAQTRQPLPRSRPAAFGHASGPVRGEETAVPTEQAGGTAPTRVRTGWCHRPYQ